MDQFNFLTLYVFFIFCKTVFHKIIGVKPWNLPSKITSKFSVFSSGFTLSRSCLLFTVNGIMSMDSVAPPLKILKASS